MSLALKINHYGLVVEWEPKYDVVFWRNYIDVFFSQLIGQYPPPPPVATGPGLDRPLFIPTPDYNSEGYTMNRTRLFYQDHLDAAEAPAAAPTAFIYPEVCTILINCIKFTYFAKKKLKKFGLFRVISIPFWISLENWNSKYINILLYF